MKGSSLHPPTPGYRSVGHSPCLIYSTGPLHHLPLPQLPVARDLAPRTLISRFSPWSPNSLGLPLTLVRGVTAHVCQPFTHSVHTAASLTPMPGQGYDHQHPCHGPGTYAYTHGPPGGPAWYLPHRTHFSFARGGGGARVAQAYSRPQDAVPQGMAPTGCHYGTPAPVATQPVSTPASLAPVTGSLVLKTYAMMGSRAGRSFCISL